ncbi:MAG: YncE family protein [Longimicrobiales bacterium]
MRSLAVFPRLASPLAPRLGRLAPLLGTLALSACAAFGAGTRPAAVVLPEFDAGGAPSYWVLVANESSDVISALAFSPATRIARVRDNEVGWRERAIDGVHGLAVSPDGRVVYVTISHGDPEGYLLRLAAPGDSTLARAPLGLFPSSITLARDGEYAFVTNYNLHGPPTASTVAVIYAPTMTRVARVETCVMPTGGAVDVGDRRHYSVCQHSDQLVQIDVRSFEVTGRMSLQPGEESPLALDDTGERITHALLRAGACGPTAVAAGAGPRADTHVYVACARTGMVLEVDVRAWNVARRFETGATPHDVAVTRDGGKLIVALQGAQTVAVYDLFGGAELARIETSEALPHGVAITPDGLYAFVSNEATGATVGTVDVIDLVELRRVGSVDMLYQPGAIDFWTMGR